MTPQQHIYFFFSSIQLKHMYKIRIDGMDRKIDTNQFLRFRFFEHVFEKELFFSFQDGKKQHSR